MLWLVVLASVWGCASSVSTSQEKRSPQPPEDLSSIQVSDLAGEWEYEEGNVVYPLTFDRKGNGAYEWKDGQFTTTSVVNHRWIGTWYQRENDREGGFEIQLSGDVLTATGRWWYTRIEQDHDPLDSGGTFTLTRQTMDGMENESKVSGEHGDD